MSEDPKFSAEGLEADSPESEDFEGADEGVTDEMVDEASDSMIDGEAVVSAEAESAEGEAEEDEEFELEEEKVKDEVDIQIDLLQDSDWVVRREAVVTLGEMADERCVEPLVRALRDGDWQVREAAVDAVAEVGPPAVDMLIRFSRDWESRKYVLRTLAVSYTHLTLPTNREV